MLDRFTSAEDRLIDAMTNTGRGPKRNGLFALWLFLRLCRDRLPPDPVSERAQRRHLENVNRRLSSLSLPAPLRRALATSMRDLRDAGLGPLATALQQLAAPARETVGAEAGDAIAQLARRVRAAVRSHAA
jgi:hypothetical protein